MRLPDLDPSLSHGKNGGKVKQVRNLPVYFRGHF